jgi:hypothetical protein
VEVYQPQRGCHTTGLGSPGFATVSGGDDGAPLPHSPAPLPLGVEVYRLQRGVHTTGLRSPGFATVSGGDDGAPLPHGPGPSTVASKGH